MENYKNYKKLTADNVSYAKAGKSLGKGRDIHKVCDGKKVIAECRTKGTCFICRKVGHVAKHCPNRERRRQLARQHKTTTYSESKVLELINALSIKIDQICKMIRSRESPKAMEISRHQLSIIPVKTTQPQVKQMVVKLNPGPHVVCLPVEQFKISKDSSARQLSIYKKPLSLGMTLTVETTSTHSISKQRQRQIEKNGYQPATIGFSFKQYTYDERICNIPRHLGLDYMLDEFFVRNAIDVFQVMEYLRDYQNKLTNYLVKLGFDFHLYHQTNGKQFGIQDEKKISLVRAIFYRIRHQYFNQMVPTYHHVGIPSNTTPRAIAQQLSKSLNTCLLYNEKQVATYYGYTDKLYGERQFSGKFYYGFINGKEFRYVGNEYNFLTDAFKRLNELEDCDYSDDINEVARYEDSIRRAIEEHH